MDSSLSTGTLPHLSSGTQTESGSSGFCENPSVGPRECADMSSCIGGLDDPTVVIVAGRLMRPRRSATTVNVSSRDPCASTDPDAGSQSHAHRPRLWAS